MSETSAPLRSGSVRLPKSLWDRRSLKFLSPTARVLRYLVLPVDPHIDECGVVPYTPERWSKASGIALVEVLLALDELEREWEIDVEDGCVLIPEFMEDQGTFNSPSRLLAAHRAAARIRSERMLTSLQAHYGDWADIDYEGGNGSAPFAADPVRAQVRAEVFLRDDFTCRDCGWRPPEEVIPAEYDGRYGFGPFCVFPAERALHVDHIVSRARGGRSVVANLQTLCGSCNATKGAR